MKNRNNKSILTFILIAIMIITCTRESSETIPVSYDTVSTLLVEGWDFYRDGKFSNAIINFVIDKLNLSLNIIFFFLFKVFKMY